MIENSTKYSGYRSNVEGMGDGDRNVFLMLGWDNTWTEFLIGQAQPLSRETAVPERKNSMHKDMAI